MHLNDRNERIVYAGSRDVSDVFSCLLAGVTNPNPEYRMTRYPASEYVFEYVIDGHGWIEQRGEKIAVGPGMFYMIKKGAEVTYYADLDDPYEKIWLNADGEMLGRMCDVFRTDDVLVAEASVLDLFLEIHDRLSRVTDNIAEESAEILCLLFRILTAATKNTFFPPLVRHNSLPERIHAYLDANVYADISLDTVSEEFGVTKMHIIRVFKKRYGITPGQYLIEKKIGIAKSLLTGTLMPIKEISALLHYSNTQHCSSSFRNSVGVTPNKYRQSSRKK